jgi:BirA family biotin operon repressor/biotin-[acetyl-CoA-carboxylase] ligase
MMILSSSPARARSTSIRPSGSSFSSSSSKFSHLFLGISVTLLLVWFGSNILVTAASSPSSMEDDDDQDDPQEGVCGTTAAAAAAATTVTTTTTTTTTTINEESINSSSNNNNNNNDNNNNSSSSPKINSHPDDPSLQLFHYMSVNSTQDDAKRIVLQDEIISSLATTTKTFCVTTTEQTKGRGTSGRQWMGASGNTFVTIGIPQQTWIASRIPLTLLPLKIGSLVAQQVQGLILDKHHCGGDTNTNTNTNNKQHNMVSVKWPNDVLVNEQKISGVLIESAKDWFLIGIGVNLAYAPTVPTSGPNHGRPATCLQNICDDKDGTVVDWEDEAHQLGVRLAWELHSFLHTDATTKSGNQRSAEAVLEEWKSWVDWDMELVMRDTPNRERVKLIGVLPDGRVRVVGQDDGIQRTLVSDYFL